MLTRKFIAVDAYINKNKHSQINNQILYLKELKKEGKLKPKLAEVSK